MEVYRKENKALKAKKTEHEKKITSVSLSKKTGKLSLKGTDTSIDVKLGLASAMKKNDENSKKNKDPANIEGSLKRLLGDNSKSAKIDYEHGDLINNKKVEVTEPTEFRASLNKSFGLIEDIEEEE